MNALTQLRIVAWLEGVSFVLLLFVAMPLKYLAGLALAVRITGSVHGLLFLWFVSALFRAADEHAWSRRRSLAAFGWSLVPFGMLVLERTIRRELQHQQ
jgi:integral membrane protein